MFCLYVGLNAPLFHHSICSWQQHPSLHMQFCACLFVSGSRDLAGPSLESCQHSEDKLSAVHGRGNRSSGSSCLENLINVWVSNQCPVFLSVCQVPPYFILYQSAPSHCSLTLGVFQHRPGPSLTSDMQSI